MPGMTILYIMVLCGSLAFGVQAIFIGMGGRAMVWYGRNRSAMLAGSLCLGLCIGVTAILTNEFLGMGVAWLAPWLVVYTVAFGAILRALPGKRGREIRPVEDGSDEELRMMLERRGLGELAEERRRS